MNPVKLGIILILLGFVFVVAGALFSAQESSFGGFIMIGPIPIAFGSSPEITIIAMLIGLLLVLLYFIGRRNA